MWCQAAIEKKKKKKEWLWSEGVPSLRIRPGHQSRNTLHMTNCSDVTARSRPLFVLPLAYITLIWFDPSGPVQRGWHVRSGWPESSRSQTTDDATFCTSPLKKLLQTDLPRKSLGFCARALESHWYRRGGGLSLLTLRKLFYPVVPCATSFERGALKIKGEVARAVSSHCLSSRRSFMLCGICLFIFFFLQRI